MLDQEVPESDYNIKMTVDGNYIGGENVKRNNYEVTLNFEIIDVLSKNLTGCVLELLNSNDQEITLNNGDSINFTTAERTTTTKVVFTKASAPDGKYTFVLRESANGPIIDKVTTQINNIKPLAVDANTNRTGGSTGTFSVAAKEVETTKLYYVVPTTENNTDYESGSKKAPTNIKEEAIKNKTVVDLENNKVNVSLEGLTENKTHTVYYVLESKYNTLSDKYSKIVAKDENVTKATQVTNPSAPGLQDLEDVNFTWTKVDESSTYIVRVYDENRNVIYEKALPAKTEKFDVISALKSAKLENVAGTYEAKLVTVGDGTTKVDSDPKSLGSVTIEQLKPVTDVRVTVEKDGSADITFTDSNESVKVKGYEFKVLKYDDAKKEYKEDSSVEVSTLTETNNKKYAILSSESDFKANTSYKIQVIAKANTNLPNILDSKVAESEKDFYKVQVGTITAGTVTDNSITFTIDEIKIANKTTNYSVETYLSNETTKVENLEFTSEVKNGKVTFTVTGLTAATSYKFKVIVTVDDVSGESSLSNSAATLVTVPTISELIVGTATNKETTGYIYYDNSNKTLYADGKTYNLNSDDYGTDFETNIIGIIKLLKPQDVITVNGNTITLKVGQGEVNNIGFAAFAKDKVLDITIGNYGVTITSTKASQPAEIILRGTSETYTISALYAKTITLFDGVKVKTATTEVPLLVKEGTTGTTINDVKMYTGSDTNIMAKINSNNATITIDASKSLNEDLTFESRKANANVSIIFNGNTNGTSTYNGTLKLDVENSKMAVTQTQVAMSEAIIDITMKKATVDLSDAHIIGKKNIKVTVEGTDNSTLTLLTDDSLPQVISTELELLPSYKNNELDTYGTNANIIVEYINKHFAQLIGTGAKIKTSGSQLNKVEITFTKTITDSVTVQ